MDKPSAQSLRLHSRFTLLRALLSQEPATRQQLTRRTGLSAATVSTIVNELIRAGVVTIRDIHHSGIGRPHAILEVNRDAGRLLGVDVAETYVQATVYDLTLTALGVMTEALDESENSPDYVVEGIRRAVVAVLARAGLSMDQIDGIGISLPGQVEPDAGVSVFAPNWEWRDVDVERLLERRLERPVYVDNPLKAIALAELWFGAGRTETNFAVVNLGTGVGVGLALDGQIVRGVTNNAGEWGHTLLSLDGRACRCGRRGCVEAYVGAAGIRETLREIDPDHPALGLARQSAFIDAVGAGRRAGEETIIAVVDRTGAYLGAALGDLINLINPPWISLTGWTVSRLGEWLIPAALHVLPQHALSSSLAAVRIEPTTISENVVSLGMATLSLEHFLAGAGVPSRTLVR